VSLQVSTSIMHSTISWKTTSFVPFYLELTQTNQTVELKVRMCCDGCARVVRHALQSLRGVDSVEVDVPMEKVSVTGYLDRGAVLRAVRRSGKKAEFWPTAGTPLRWFTSPRSYFRDAGGSYRGDSYNYRHHGYTDGDRHGRVREPARGAHPVGNMFNDDDVNAACRVMLCDGRGTAPEAFFFAPTVFSFFYLVGLIRAQSEIVQCPLLHIVAILKISSTNNFRIP
jgi:copper chaperone CopZ